MAKDQDQPQAEEEGGGGKKKLLLIAAVAVVLLLGGGAAAFVLLGSEADEVAEAGAAPEPPIVGEPTYHDMKPEFVVNLPPGGKARMLQAALQVYTTDPDLPAQLDRHAPMLRHHLFDVLAAQSADALYTRAGREQLQQQLRDELVSKLEAAGTAEPRVEAVYFTQFVLQ